MINSVETYKYFADFYDLYVGKFDGDLVFYKSLCQKADSILEVGCGTGRILQPLLKKGYKITGVDNCAEMLEKAENKLKKNISNGDLQLLNHNFSESSLDEKFNKAFLTFYTFNYIIKEPVNFLRNIYNSLHEEGLIILDLFYPKSLFNKKIDNSWTNKEYHIDGKNILIKDNRQMLDNIEYRQQIFCLNNKELKIDSHRKYYSPPEIKKFLMESGFKNIEFSLTYNVNDFYTGISESQLKTNFIVRARK